MKMFTINRLLVGSEVRDGRVIFPVEDKYGIHEDRRIGQFFLSYDSRIPGYVVYWDIVGEIREYMMNLINELIDKFRKKFESVGRFIDEFGDERGPVEISIREESEEVRPFVTEIMGVYIRPSPDKAHDKMFVDFIHKFFLKHEIEVELLPDSVDEYDLYVFMMLPVTPRQMAEWG